MNTKQIILSVSFFIGFLFTTTCFSQTKNIGGGLAYGTEIKNIGINLTGQYFINDKMAIEASFTYYLPKDYGNGLSSKYKLKWYEINANLNYYFKVNNDKIKPYGLGGLNVSFLTIPTFSIGNLFGGGSGIDNQTFSKIGLNIGGGVDFDLGKKLVPFGQLKYILSNADQLQILAGIRYTL